MITTAMPYLTIAATDMDTKGNFEDFLRGRKFQAHLAFKKYSIGFIARSQYPSHAYSNSILESRTIALYHLVRQGGFVLGVSDGLVVGEQDEIIIWGYKIDERNGAGC